MDIIEEFIQHYVREYDYYLEAARICAQQCEDLLIQNGIRAIVTYRAKRVDRLGEKLKRRNTDKKYSSTDAIYQDIVDLSGVRIALYFPGDREETQRIIESAFAIDGVKKVFPQKKDAPPNNGKRFSGYWATHYHIRLKDESVQEVQKRYCDAHIEIQIASVLMHAWSEVEHDLVYKPQSGNLSADEYAILDQLNGLVLSGELGLELLERAIKARASEKNKTFRNHYELSSYLYDKFRANFPDKDQEPKMGRADVLFRFLQLSMLDAAGVIEKLDLIMDGDTEKRSISDQLIDQILRNNPKLFRQYRQAQDESDSINRYLSSDGGKFSFPDEAAVGLIVNSWESFERAIRNAGEQNQSGDKWGKNLPFIQVLKSIKSFPKEWLNVVITLRNTRNQVVHGRSRISIEEAQKYKSTIDKIIQDWRNQTGSVEEQIIVDQMLGSDDKKPEEKEDMSKIEENKMRSFELEDYLGYKILANRVPDQQFDFDGFGWGLAVRDPLSNKPVLFAVVKSFRSKATPENLDYGLEHLTEEVHKILREGEPYKQYYCYQWEPDDPESVPFSEGDCGKISPVPFRSPFI